VFVVTPSVPNADTTMPRTHIAVDSAVNAITGAEDGERGVDDQLTDDGPCRLTVPVAGLKLLA
jgi:hypothetical protein